MTIFRFFLIAAFAGAPLAFAVETRSWTHNSREDFEKGTLKNVSLRSDGRLTLAPVFRELADPGTAYLWALAVDSKGNLYSGGGGPGASTSKLTVIDPAGKARTLAELQGLQVQAVAVDQRDRVYAATAPDGKVYRIASDGKPELFYDPKAKYIWAMAFNSRGELFVATGDAGEVHRVGTDGTGAVFFRTEETHARSLTVDSKDNVIVGTEPGGLILRITPAGEGFVLHQSPKREVTAVGVTRDGVIYASALGNKTSGLGGPGLSIPVPPAPQPTAPGAAPGAARPAIQPAPVIPPPSPASPPSISGGSEVYRIGTDGYAQRVWNHPQDLVYSIAFDAQSRPILGTGNKGNIYRIETDQISTLLIHAIPTQVTALTTGPDGRVYAATGNVGKVFQIGPGTESQGTYESDSLDAGSFSWWGRVRQKAAGTPARVETRSGNLDRPHKNWSPWAPLDSSGRVASPAARFLQYRVTLAGGGDLREIELAWMPRNVAPTIEEIEITPANYKFQPPSALTPPSQTITLPALGQRRRTVPSLSLDTGSSSQTMQYTRGWLGARWAITDANADDLIYKVEIRGVNEREWKLLRDKVKERYLSWDATAYPDGEYVLRVTASDAPDNPPGSALTAQLDSDQFTVDNTAPRISGLSGTRSGANLTIQWSARDDRSVVSRAEYSLNGTDWVVVEPATRLSDAPQLDYTLTIPSPGAEASIAVRVTDEYDNQSVEKVLVH